MRASLILNEVGIGLRRNLTMSIALVITFAVSLGLLGGALLVRDQVDVMKDYWYDKVQVSIFLCTKNSDSASCAGGAVTEAQKAQIKDDLETLKPLVQDVFYESSADAYARFKEQFKNSPIAQNASPDALPESFRVKLSDPTKYDVIASAFSGRPGIDNVVDQTTDSVTVRAIVPNAQGALKDGQIARAVVEVSDPQPQLTVPVAAVVIDQAGPSVMVVGGDGKVEQRRLTLGPQQGVETVVSKGLNAGDRVIVDGLQKVRPGQVVQASVTKTAGS